MSVNAPRVGKSDLRAARATIYPISRIKSPGRMPCSHANADKVTWLKLILYKKR